MSVRTPYYRYQKSTGQAVVTIDGRDLYLGKHGLPESEEAQRRNVPERLVGGRAGMPQRTIGAPGPRSPSSL